MKASRTLKNRKTGILDLRTVTFEEKEILRFNTTLWDDDRVLVIVPTWNSVKQLPACLTSIENQAVLKMDLIVSDNGSEDGTEAYVKENHPRFRFLQSDNGMGISTAINRALEFAGDATYVAVVYPGSQVRYDCMIRQINALSNDEDAGIATPRIMEADHPKVFRRMGMAITSIFESFSLGAIRYAHYDCFKPCYVPATSGACMMIRREVLKKLGPFDENYMLCWEDVEFSFRATINGYKCLYEPHAVVHETNTAIMDPWSRMNVYHHCRGILPTAMKFLPDETLFHQCNELLMDHLKNAFVYYGCGGRLITALKGKWAGFKLAREIYRKRKAGLLDEYEEDDPEKEGAEKTPEQLEEEQKAREKLKKKRLKRLEKNLIRGDRLWKISREVEGLYR